MIDSRPRKPPAVNTMPSATSVEGTFPSPSTALVHSFSPVSRSNPCTTSPASLTTCTRPSGPVHKVGVPCEMRVTPRIVFHRSLPVFASSASTYDLSHGFCQPISLSSPSELASIVMMSRPPVSTGEAPNPCWL